ncbi:hypothetical protein SAMN02745171_00073 [Porphyromonas circumdentaria]|uniref:Uncharacterized protein n=1 Tax=Porphyromonas circumdentaria TaxID=29524 RepID=A0A1T4KJK1_9PORP|nr:hypothetical protein [Porphyromonas circumdentaria]SJZ42557.1 hypothetical protein SAMN02745171_00073 [Porphyromonas circumdentaria]
MIPVVGLDFHISGSSNPFHPYIDPADYIPYLGSSALLFDNIQTILPLKNYQVNTFFGEGEGVK